jgi:DNA-binding MarR family transcriptional regulator
VRRGNGITPLETELNDLLTLAFRSVREIEEDMLKNSKGLNLSISEMHLLQTVYDTGQGCTISMLSASQRISLPSVTAAVNKLAHKGYVEKQKSPADGRVVLVTLTRTGRKAVMAHRYFHTRMVRAVSQALNTDEQEAMLKGVQRLNQFFADKLHHEEKKI